MKTSKITLFTLTACIASGLAEITTYAEYHLGEDGQTAGIIDSGGQNLNFTSSTGDLANVAIQTDNIVATGSTAYLATDVNGSANVGWFSANFSNLPTDDFAVGIFVQAVDNTLDTQGLVVSLGSNAASVRINLAPNGWGVSVLEPVIGDPLAEPPVLDTPATWVGPVDGTGFVADTWAHLVVIRSGGVTSFYIDGVDQGDPDSVNVPEHTASGHMSVNPGGRQYFDGKLDEMRVVTFTPGEAAADIIAALAGIDSDDDGLFDGFEQKIIDAVPGDAFETLADVLPGDDFDGDTLSNIEEQSRGTDPTDSEDPKTDPSTQLQLLAFWDFNDTADPAVALDNIAGYSGSVQGGAVFTADAGGRTGAAGDFAMDFGATDGGQSMSVDNTEFLEAINGSTEFDHLVVSFWQKNTATGNSVSFNFNSAEGIRVFQSHLPWGNGNIFFDHWNGTSQSYTRVAGAPPAGLDFTEWHHYLFVKDGATKEIYIDGELSLSGDGLGLATTITSLNLGAESSGLRSLQGMIDDFAIFDRALTAGQITALAAGASPDSLIAPPADPEITNITRDGNMVTLTWSSNSTDIFTVFYSFDLINFEADLEDGIAADAGSTTTRTFDLSGTDLEGVEKVFFRVER